MGQEQKENNRRIESDAETAPLITKGCSFDDKTGTIIIDTRKLIVSALGLIDQSKIKQLRMK